ncbi:MAG TPA: hypothetical protein DCM07_02565, partial [Planctomycetaceae bacterium]|nr:hypothetical protein [Planctomycetaceae bacterium]
ATATGIDKSVKLVPGSGPGQVVIDGDLKLDGNDIVDIEVNGTIAGTQYDQFVVNGDLALGGATLNLIDGHTPGIAESFILIKNDGPNPVTGTFNGYPEGHEFTDFLGVAGLSAFLTYSGGDGNDVAIYTEIPSPVVTIPNDGAADEYTLQIIGSNVVITEVGSGNIISNYHLAALGGALVINGEAGENDTLTIDMTGIDETTDLQIIFNGGAGGHDTLELVGGNLDSMEFLYVDPSTGSIRLNNSGSDFISYTGLEPVTSTVNATNVTLTYTGGAETIEISDLGGGQTRVDSSLGEMTDFINPTGTLTINAGTGADTINIISLAADYSANIIINGDDETDTINVDASVSLAAGKSIQFNAETFDLDNGFSVAADSIVFDGTTVTLDGDLNSASISGNVTTVNIEGSAGGAEIQDAIDLAASGATINVAAGTYSGLISLNKSVDLLGANAGIDPNGMARAAESIIDHNGFYAIQPTANDVTIDGFSFEGNGGRVIDSFASADNLTIANNIFNNTNIPGVQGGIQLQSGSFDDLTVEQNLFQFTGDGNALVVGGGGSFERMHIVGNHFAGTTGGIFQNGGTINDAVVEQNEFTGGVGMNMGAAGNIQIRENTFDGNTFTGFQVGTIGGEIVGNTFQNIEASPGFFGQAFELWGGQYGTTVSENVTIENNVIHYND